MSSQNLDRARLLLEQNRGKDAEEYARLAIAEDTENPGAYLALSSALYQQNNFKEAIEPAKQAVSLAPDYHYCHYQIAFIQYNLRSWKNAEAAALESLRLYPEDADAYGLLSYLAARKSKWERSLELAEQGLSFDGDHITCTNARANALTKLKRSHHAHESLDYALQRDPENPLTHYQKGRSLLETGDYANAAKHFCETLRIDPDFSEAKDGLVEALKGRHFIYSIFLKYIFFMARLEPKVQWGIILGGYFGQRMLASFLRSSGYGTAANGVLITYMAIVYFTWTASSLFNLLLFVHPLGRHALSKVQKYVSATTAGAIILALLTLALYLFSGYRIDLLSIIAFALITLPISVLPRVSKRSKFKVVVAISSSQFALAFASVFLAIFNRFEAAELCANIVILSSVGFTWLSSFITK